MRYKLSRRSVFVRVINKVLFGRRRRRAETAWAPRAPRTAAGISGRCRANALIAAAYYRRRINETDDLPHTRTHSLNLYKRNAPLLHKNKDLISVSVQLIKMYQQCGVAYGLRDVRLCGKVTLIGRQ